ncbi:MAG TPA: type II toxin-antitoxin system PemK/MazF family toxin [Oscillospiraceae bacterium]|nr:type II toxin-antitoxin system PemK/MazF family toxin [Oscillospiraceae bacterium]
MNRINVAPVRGSIFFADLGIGEMNEQFGVRPVLVIQNDKGNQYSPTVIVAAISSKIKRMDMLTHVILDPTEQNGLKETSIVLTEQIRTISRNRLFEYIGFADTQAMKNIDKALLASIGITKNE